MEYEFIEVRGAHFTDEAVEVDGREFIDCTFANATLQFAGKAPFILGPCKGDFSIEFVGEAKTTLDQLRALHRFGFGAAVEQIIASIRNPLAESYN